jgi:ADP-ribose pyrophosphatase YjhB (NUDIX family)
VRVTEPGPTPSSASDPGRVDVHRVLEIAIELAGIAQTGLSYDPHVYDADRYRHVAEAAVKLFSAVGTLDPTLTREVISADVGHATPKVDARGAVFRDGEVLLVREATDGLWTLPGGWVDPVDTPSSAVAREIREEAGVEVEVLELAAVLDRATQGHLPVIPASVFKLHFVCRLVDPAAVPQADGVETPDARFWPLDALPPLSLSRIFPRQIALLAAHAATPGQPAYFD